MKKEATSEADWCWPQDQHFLGSTGPRDSRELPLARWAARSLSRRMCSSFL